MAGLGAIRMLALKDGAARFGIKLDDRQVRLFESYYADLSVWNRRANLTSITDYTEVQVKHFLDSLTVLLAIREYPGFPRVKAIDVGSGAGMPGVPLKIACPEIDMTLLEATGKKIAFLNHLKETLRLNGMEVICGRAEDTGRQPGQREQYDIVLGRAVATLPTLLELTLPFCRIGGIFVAQKQVETGPETERSTQAANTLGGRLREIIEVDLPQLPPQRRLLVYEKGFATPTKYPRRPGMPAKRPII